MGMNETIFFVDGENALKWAIFQWTGGAELVAKPNKNTWKVYFFHTPLANVLDEL